MFGMESNPYTPPTSEPSQPSPPPTVRSGLRTVGTLILVTGVAATVYGVIACFVKQDLPPNGGLNGRLPSIYIMFGGFVVMIVGSTVRDFRRARTAAKNSLAPDAERSAILSPVLGVRSSASRFD
jgi:hypothetical protein